MRYFLGILVAVAAAGPALASIRLAPAPDLAAGAPAVIAVIGAFTATRIARFRRKR